MTRSFLIWPSIVWLAALAGCSEDGGAAEARAGAAGSAGSAAGGAGGTGGSAGSGSGGASGSAACNPVVPSLARIGSTFIVPTLETSVPKRNPDVAHDPQQDVYLVVTGAEVISGTFVDGDGQSLGAPFAVAQTSAYTQTPRVAYGGGKFIVAWHDNRNGSPELRARLVSWVGGSADLSLADFAVSVGGNSYHEMGAAIAWSETSQCFLVVWQAVPGDDIRARRVDGNGVLVGDEIVITQDADWQSGAAAAWSSTRDEFLVSFTHAGAAGAAVRARRISASDGGLIGEQIELVTAGGTWTTQLAHSPCNDRWFAGWVADGAAGVELDADGTPLSAPFAFPAGHGYPDGFAVTRHPLTNTLAAVMHGPSDEDMGCALLASGEQSAMIAVTEDPGDDGHFNPRITANALRQEWMLVTSLGFATVVAQRLGP